MKRLVAAIAFLTLAAFLAVLALEVPSPDLVAVIVVTVLFVGYDFLTSSGKHRS